MLVENEESVVDSVDDRLVALERSLAVLVFGAVPQTDSEATAGGSGLHVKPAAEAVGIVFDGNGFLRVERVFEVLSRRGPRQVGDGIPDERSGERIDRRIDEFSGTFVGVGDQPVIIECEKTRRLGRVGLNGPRPPSVGGPGLRWGTPPDASVRSDGFRLETLEIDQALEALVGGPPAEVQALSHLGGSKWPPGVETLQRFPQRVRDRWPCHATMHSLRRHISSVDGGTSPLKSVLRERGADITFPELYVLGSIRFRWNTGLIM
jgi:hypothetical protein